MGGTANVAAVSVGAGISLLPKGNVVASLRDIAVISTAGVAVMCPRISTLVVNDGRGRDVSAHQHPCGVRRITNGRANTKRDGAIWRDTADLPGYASQP